MPVRDRTSVRTSRFPNPSIVDRILTYSEIIRHPDTLGIVTLCHVSANGTPTANQSVGCGPSRHLAGVLINSKWHVTNPVH